MRKILYFIFLGPFLFECCEMKPADTIEDEKDTCAYTGYYYYENAKNFFGELSGDYLLIGIDSAYSDSSIVAFVNSQGIFKAIRDTAVEHYDYYKYKHVLAQLSVTRSCIEIGGIIRELNRNEIISYTHYTTKWGKCLDDNYFPLNKPCVLTYSSHFYVDVYPLEKYSLLSYYANLTHTKIVEQNEFMSSWFTLRADKNSSGDALKMANYFYETGHFRAAEPGFFQAVPR